MPTGVYERTPCAPGCACRKHVKRTRSADTRARISAAAKARGYNHPAGCNCAWCGINPAAVKHGDSTRARRTPEYLAWQNMRARCLRPSHPSYFRYGGRGITICGRWDSFANFLADMGKRPGPGYSIDRIDNDGNYEPGNCRWTTQDVQNRHRQHDELGRWC